MSSSRLLELLKHDEGAVIKNGLHVAYTDSLGYQTIGYGRLIDHRPKGGLTEEEAEYLLKNDVTRSIRLLDINIPWWRGLNEARQAVMISMVYNLGMAGLLKFKDFLDFMQKGKYQQASVEMLDSKWATQIPQRANRLSDMMRTGEY